MSPLACFPCWGPKLWRRGSPASSCSVHCDWTSRPRWRRWSRRKKIGCSDPQAPQRLKWEGKSVLSFWKAWKTSVMQQRDLHFECLSQRAAARMSHRRMVPLLLLYTNTLHWCGWHSAAVITSVSSSMLAGLMSTISGRKCVKEQLVLCDDNAENQLLCD